LPGACRTDRVSWHHRLPAWHGGPHNSTNLRGRTRLQAAAAASPEEEEADEGEVEVVVLEDAIILEAQVVSTTAELGVRRILNFRAGGRARAGGLEHVTMQFELTDGRSTGGTFLDPGPLLDDPVGRSMLHASMWMSSRPRREASTNSPSSTPCHSIRSSSGQPPALAGLDQPRTIAGVAWLAGPTPYWHCLHSLRHARRLRRRRPAPSRMLPARTSPASCALVPIGALSGVSDRRCAAFYLRR